MMASANDGPEFIVSLRTRQLPFGSPIGKITGNHHWKPPLFVFPWFSAIYNPQNSRTGPSATLTESSATGTGHPVTLTEWPVPVANDPEIRAF
jgi:hypothetical protein